MAGFCFVVLWLLPACLQYRHQFSFVCKSDNQCQAASVHYTEQQIEIKALDYCTAVFRELRRAGHATLATQNALASQNTATNI